MPKKLNTRPIKYTSRDFESIKQDLVDYAKRYYPNTYKDLLKLKGVGDYTASAIASICFDEQTAVVDGNVYGVLSRYFGIATPINSPKGIKDFKLLAQSLLETDNPGQYNQAIMDFGALQCTPKAPDCNTCPLSGGCAALKSDFVGAPLAPALRGFLPSAFFLFML